MNGTDETLCECAGDYDQQILYGNCDESVCTGRISAMESALVTTGLLWAGKAEAAKETAGRWCAAIMQPVSPVWPAERGFSGSVTAAAFQILAALAE